MASALVGLAAIEERRHRAPDAAALYDRALRLRESTVGAEHISVAAESVGSITDGWLALQNLVTASIMPESSLAQLLLQEGELPV